MDPARETASEAVGAEACAGVVAINQRVPSGRPLPELDAHEAARRYFAEAWWTRNKLVRLCVLMLLYERPSYGYDLRRSLGALGFDSAVASRVYRVLHWMDGLDLVDQGWEVTQLGPARRVYHLTAAGTRLLESIAPDVRRRADRVSSPSIRRYVTRCVRELSSSKSAFAFQVTTTVLVESVHASGARHKVERLFGTPKTIHADIRTTGTFELHSVTPVRQSS